MLYAEVYKDGELLDEGSYLGGKHWTESNPDQSVYFISKNTGKEVDYEHSDSELVYFITYNNDGDIWYDSRERIDHDDERRKAYQNEIIGCPNCGNENATRGELDWVYDNYGNPFKKCCSKCSAEVERYISGWHFDESYAGECLE